MTASLRLRLTAIILIPLLVIAILVGVWQWQDARAQATDLFDRSLLSTGLAIAADVARSGGDALSIETRDLLSDTSGGPVYYHAYAPDGVYVIGYATPPVHHEPAADPEEPFQYYDSTYYGRPVRALRLVDVTSVDGISGPFTYTVWQEFSVRDALLRQIALRAFTVISVMIGALALVVWFGVRIGLRPLTDLEDAISRRSSDDLSPIRRAVPEETRGLVDRLNTLFGQVEASMAAQASFISNAAHQLRNPIAGVMAMAEAVRSARTLEAARERAAQLLRSARDVKDLANKLLTLERASAAGDFVDEVNLNAVLRDIAAAHQVRAEKARIRIETDLPRDTVFVQADLVMLREAITNLVDNALRHGGPALGSILLRLSRSETSALVEVQDDGAGIAPEDAESLLARFGQAVPGEGSGLGLSIAEAVAQSRGGALELDGAPASGLTVRLKLPISAQAAVSKADDQGQRPAA